MPKNAVKPESAEPYSEQTRLGASIPIVMGVGPMACRLKISGKALQAAGMLPRDLIEVTARAGEILIKRIAEAEPSPWSGPRPESPAQKEMAELMTWTRERQARLDGLEPEDEEAEAGDEVEDGTEDGLGLNEAQRRQGEL